METRFTPDAFSLAVAGNGIAALFLPSCTKDGLMFVWICYAFMISLCMGFAQTRKQALCIMTLISALLFGLALILRLPSALRLDAVLLPLGCLLVVWPLRFLALGELASALLFGAFYWKTTFSIAGASADGWLLGLLSSLLLFATAFIENAAVYRQQKSVQCFTLPVLLGYLLPVLDRRLTSKPFPPKLAFLPAVLNIVCGVVIVFHAFFAVPR